VFLPLAQACIDLPQRERKYRLMQYLAFRCTIVPNYGIVWDKTTNSVKLVCGLGGSPYVH
jgi:hypothetical protein